MIRATTLFAIGVLGACRPEVPPPELPPEKPKAAEPAPPATVTPTTAEPAVDAGAQASATDRKARAQRALDLLSGKVPEAELKVDATGE